MFRRFVVGIDFKYSQSDMNFYRKYIWNKSRNSVEIHCF